jgi:hypothetical protein
MKKISFAVFLLFVAAASVRQVGAATLYTEKGYFSVNVPAGWEKVEQYFGLSQEEKKVFGADFTGAVDRDGIASRISVHYYAPGNIVHRSAEKFIQLHAQSVFGVGVDLDGEKYGPVKEGRVGGHPAKIFDRITFEYVPPESIRQKKIPMVEKFAVVPAKDGFYVLCVSSPEENSKASLKAYASVLASFKMLGR